MLSLEDCLDFCDLEHDEIEALAEHEHIPVIVAAELGCELLKSPAGIASLTLILRDNVEHAIDRGLTQRAEHYADVYRHFVAAHPLPLAA